MTSLDFAFPPRMDHENISSPSQIPAINIERGDSGTNSQSSQSSEDSATTANTAFSSHSDMATRAASPRKHAHRRSAAVSCDFDAQVLFNKHDYIPSNPHKQTNTNILTPQQQPQPQQPSPKKDVVFVEPKRLESPSRTVSPSESLSLSHMSPQVSSRSASPSKSPKKNRHKKVRSWAGSLIKFRSSSSLKKNKNTVNSSADDTQSPTLASPTLHSSSYIATNDPFYCSGAGSPEACPSPTSRDFETIDLDAALTPLTQPFSANSNRFHRRSESAPETMLDPTRGMKRKIRALVGEDLLSMQATSAEDAIIEEEEPTGADALDSVEANDPILTPASSACSQLVSANASASSLVSVSSSSTRSRSHTRFHRSYNNDLAQAMKERKERDEREKRLKEPESEVSAAATPSKLTTYSTDSTPTALAPTGTTHLQSPLRTVRKKDAPRLMGSPSRIAARDLPRYTYEEDPRFSMHYSFTSEWCDDFGEPGPVEHVHVNPATAAGPTGVNRHTDHFNTHPSHHKNVAARMWGWVKRK